MRARVPVERPLVAHRALCAQTRGEAQEVAVPRGARATVQAHCTQHQHITQSELGIHAYYIQWGTGSLLEQSSNPPTLPPPPTPGAGQTLTSPRLIRLETQKLSSESNLNGLNHNGTITLQYQNQEYRDYFRILVACDQAWH